MPGGAGDVNVMRRRDSGRPAAVTGGVSVSRMSDGRPDPGRLPGVRRGLCAAVRPHLHLRMRRHVDYCRTATAICRA
jgi:hypothetical protein